MLTATCSDLHVESHKSHKKVPLSSVTSPTMNNQKLVTNMAAVYKVYSRSQQQKTLICMQVTLC